MEIATFNRQSVAVAVTETNEVGQARRTALRLSSDLGLAQHEHDNVALVVTEMATNLAKYAQNGRLILRGLPQAYGAGMEIISVDSGPGFLDISRRLEDGYSSSGTSGIGIGSIRRLSQEFDIYSHPAAGTAVVSRIFSMDGTQREHERFNYGVVNLPIQGEERCGDSWAIHQDEHRTLIMLVDGLGHGAGAAEAADEAVRVFFLYKKQSPTDILNAVHPALRSTRGAVMAAVDISVDGSVIFSGIGNVSAVITDGEKSQHLVSHNGTLGVAAKARSFSHAYKNNDVLIMASDGLSTRWNLNSFPGLLTRDPSIIAAVLYQHYARNNDDVTVLVARNNGA